MAVVLGAMGSLAPKLFKLLHSEYELQKNLRKKLKFVYDELESSRAALEKVAAVPWDQLDKQVKIWACQVRDASYDMEDVLDTFLLRVEGVEPVNQSRLKRSMKRMGGLFGKFKARRDIAGAIDDIEKQLQVVSKRRARYKIDEIVSNPSPATTVDPRLSAFYTKASQLVGIDEPRDELIEMLSISEGDSSSNVMKIVSIVGFGGLGKTTLAKAVYDKVYHQFDCGAFVPVGRNPDPRKVLRDVLIDLTDDDKEKPFSDQYNTRNTISDLKELDEWQLIKKLRKFIEGKRYCIVIDDIWDIKIWEVIKNAFVDSNPRSRIIATTRNSEVSEKIGKVYSMKKLTESQSRELLFTKTFRTEEKRPDNEELAVASQKILRRCDGVPLAINTIGGLLAGKQIEEWSNVYDSVGFGLGDDSIVDNMNKILSFSYYDLPCHLRTCMLYLNVLPEDYAIDSGTLILMWIAEDLVQRVEGKELFKVGESYFLELVNRGLIQPIWKHGISNRCRVHDMVLHMIRNLSNDEYFLAVLDSKQCSQGSNFRRLALHRAELIQVNDTDMQQLRSFHATDCGTDKIPPVSRFKLLRVLSLVGCRPLEGHLDTEYLCNLLHLRFLELKDTPIRDLPKKIGNLKFLQTLVFTRSGVEELPTSLKQLTKLMCLRADNKTIVPDWICELTSLVELFMYGADRDRCFVKELGKLRDLRELYTRITLQDEREVRGFLEVLSNLENLEVIDLKTSKVFAFEDAIMEPSFVLHCNNLRELRLEPLEFLRLPKWINPQALPKLLVLQLNLYALYQQDVEILGKFENLCRLDLDVFGFLSKISIVGGARFQNLRDFRVGGLCQLEFLQGAVPRLEEILLRIPVCEIIYNYNLGLKFGLGNISALPRVVVLQFVVDCGYCLPREVEEVEAELRHAVSIHPNSPTLKITRENEDLMVTCSDSVMEAHEKRKQRLWSQIKHLNNIRNATLREMDEMAGIKTDLNPSDAKKTLLLGIFHQQWRETSDRVQHKIDPVQDGTPPHDRDLKRVLDDIKALEEALEILKLEYPLSAAWLDELRYTFSLEVALPMPEILNLNICVCDMVDKLDRINFGLLGKISSLQVIKAHVICHFSFRTEVEEVEAELRQAVDTHHPNNPPTLEIIRYAEDRMVNSDSDSQMLLQRQIRRAQRLAGRIGHHQMYIYDVMCSEAAKMGELITNLNLSDDTKNKEQRLLEHFSAMRNRVQHELLRVNEKIPNRDLKRVTEDIVDMERALDILMDEYPRLAAMLEELKRAVSFEAEDEDEVTDEEDETTEEEVSAASLSGREEGNEVTDDEVSAAWLFDREVEDEITEEEKLRSLISLRTLPWCIRNKSGGVYTLASRISHPSF